MLKLCICVTGTTGSGKTTFVRALGNRGFRTIHTGELFRSTSQTVKHGESTIAPASFDEQVYQCINRTLTSISGPVGLVAIECFPRDARQTEWFDVIRDAGWCPIVIILDASEEIRYNRVTSRNITDTKRMEHDRKKMSEENDKFKVLLTRSLEKNDIKTLTYDTSKWDYSDVHDLSTFCDMRTMINCAFNYWSQKQGYAPTNELPNLERMVFRAKEEMGEYEGSKRPEELIDSLWFLLLALRGCGWTAEQIFSKFMFKYNINEERMEKGIKPHETIIEG